MFDEDFFEDDGEVEKQEEKPVGSVAEVAFSTIYNMSQFVGLNHDHRVTSALKEIWMEPDDEETIKEILRNTMEFLEPEYRIAEAYRSPFDPLPDEEHSAGDINLGRIFDMRVGRSIGPYEEWPAQDFSLKFKELKEHTLILGRSGSGKTTLITNLLIQLIRRGVTCWAIDLYKDYRGLLNKFPDKVVVIRWKDFKFNPLRPPPGVAINTWTARFTDIICEALIGYRGAKNVIQDLIGKLFEKHNVEYTNVYPTLHDLYDLMENIPPGEMSWRTKQHLGTADSIIKMTTRNLGDVIDCDDGHPIEKLLKMNVIFELDGLSEDIKTVFINLLLGWVLTYRMAAGDREGHGKQDESRQGLKNVIAFDEAKMVFDRGREKDKRHGTPFLMEAVTVMRKFGIGLLVADQMWNMLSRSITTNVHTKICLSCQDKDLQDISRYMGLRGKAQVDQLQNLPVFNGIVKLAGRHPHPFRIMFQFPEFDREVSDPEVEIKSGYILEKLGYKPAKKKEEEVEAEVVDKEGVEEDIIPSVLPKEAGDLLRDIYDFPYSAETERYDRVDLASNKGDATVDYLVQNELVERDSAEWGRGTDRFGGGGTIVLLSLTNKGEEILGKKANVPGKGSMKHKYHQHRAYELFRERSYICEIEAKHSDAGETIDVLAGKGNLAIGIEIELDDDLRQPIKNIRKCLDHKCTRVLVFGNTKLRNKLEKELKQLEYSKDELNRIELMPISFLSPSAYRTQQEKWFMELEGMEVVDYKEKTVDRDTTEKEKQPLREETDGFNIHLGFDSSPEVEEQIKKSSVSWDPTTATNPHIMIVGMSGSGKTETLKSFVYEIYQKGIPSIVFDFHGEYIKGSFIKHVEANIVDYDKGVNINPLELPIDPETSGHTKPSKVVSEIAETIGSIYKLGSQQKPALENAIHQAYEWAGILNDDPETWNLEPPPFNQIKAGLENLHVMEDKKNTVASNVQTKMNKIFAENLFPDEEGLSIDALLTGVTVLNLKPLAWDKSLQMTLSRFFLKKIYNEMIKKQATDKIRMFCVIDEAHKVMSDGTIIEMVREARKFGLGLVMGSQSPKDFHPDVFANTATKILLKASVGKDSKVIIDNLGVFKKKERDKIKREMLSLKPGQAFLVSDQHQPYVKFNIIPLDKRVSKK